MVFKLNSTLNDETFYSKNKKTSIIQGKDTTLLYDYNLNENDTFFITQFNKDTFLVDSVRNKSLQDNNLYKHWYLRNLKKSHQLVWVENLGEKRSGWDYSKYNLMDFGGTIKSICLENNLVYWNQEFNGFEPRQISETCNFDSLKKLLSVNELYTYNLSIFPNPTISNLKINGINSGKILIYNSLGQLVLETYKENEINLSNLPNGTYNLVVFIENKILRSCFIKTDE